MTTPKPKPKRKLPPLHFKTPNREVVFAADSVKSVCMRRHLPLAFTRGRGGKTTWTLEVNEITCFGSTSEAAVRRQYVRALRYLEEQ